MKTVLKSVMAGLLASFVLLSPMFFSPVDTGLLVGLLLGFFGTLFIAKRSWLELATAYMVFNLIVLAGAQTQLHNRLWLYQLVENISLLIGMGILFFFIVAVAMSLYALFVGNLR